MDRRTLFHIPALLWASELLAQARDVAARATHPVRLGADREGVSRSVGLSSTAFKVLTADSHGALFVMEQTNTRKGGPPRHLHHDEDELFYVVDGVYVVGVGDRLVRLEAGDCVLGPRGVPHAWSFIGEGTGRLLLSYAPANRMEAFFRARGGQGIKRGQYASTPQDAAFMQSYGMELIGPPLSPRDWEQAQRPA